MSDANTSDNSIINSLKRLERAGSAESKTVTKLIESAQVVGDRICEVITRACKSDLDENDSVSLPRGYEVFRDRRECPNCGEYTTIALVHGLSSEAPVNGRGYEYCCLNRFKSGFTRTTRTTALKFAQDVATGFLDEIKALLIERTCTSQQALDHIEAAQDNLDDLAP